MTTATPEPRPREVTVGAVQAVLGGVLAVIALIYSAGQMYSDEMRDALQTVVDDPRFASLDLTLDTARTIFKYTIMVMGVVNVCALVLGVFVLRRHNGARVSLTVLGCLVAVVCLFVGPVGWGVDAYVVLSMLLLWTRGSRAWFRGRPRAGVAGGGGGASSGGSPPPPPPPRSR
ncbi:MAG: hypothetical protein ACRDQA_13565 [Nocardioidaceae bacterium]